MVTAVSKIKIQENLPVIMYRTVKSPMEVDIQGQGAPRYPSEQ